MRVAKDLRFAMLNAFGATIWATLISSIGWIFGEGAQAFLGKIQHVEGWLLLGGLVMGLAIWAWRIARRRG